jgi:hypothetical protein
VLATNASHGSVHWAWIKEGRARLDA